MPLCFLAMGCSRQADVGQVSGRVLLDGKPLPHVQVEFLPNSPGKTDVPLPMSLGETDEAGRYELRATDGRPGAVVGEHRVVVRDVALPAGGRIGSRAEAERTTSGAGPVLPASAIRLPAVYGSAGASPLRANVKSGEQSLDLELSAAAR